MASSDPAPRRFDIVVVPFPYADRLAEKRRPALVVSADAFNRKHGLLWVAMITSADNPRWDGDIPVAANARTGLPAPSAIRAAKIATIEPGRVVRVAGRIDGKMAAAVSKELVETVG
jgi:mRNA interferase MazF